MSDISIFDSEHYVEINDARWGGVKHLLEELPGDPVGTVLDVGCGPGWFADKIVNAGYQVTGLEARRELVEEARRRVPSATFNVFNVDHPIEAEEVLPADLVFCFGLLYHIENPFTAIRSLKALTGRFCLIESQMIPEELGHFRLAQESSNINQGFTHYAVIPALSSFVTMLYAAGFKNVYECTAPINHQDFVDTPTKYQRRRVLLASDETVDHPELNHLPPPHIPKYDYLKPTS